MAGIILILSFLLAAAAGWLFYQWKCPTKKEKLQQSLAKVSEVEELDVSDSEDLSLTRIKEIRTKLGEEIKKVKELKKKKEDELSDEEKQAVSLLPSLQEAQSVVQEINTPEDLNKKVASSWDWAFTGGIFFAVLLISSWLFSQFLPSSWKDK